MTKKLISILVKAREKILKNAGFYAGFLTLSVMVLAMLTTSVVLGKEYKNIVYIFRFMSDGELFIETVVTEGETLAFPESPKKQGFEFVGWELGTGSNLTGADKNIPYIIIIFEAKWNIKADVPDNEDPGNEDPGDEDPGDEDHGNKDPDNEDPDNEDPGNEDPGDEDPGDDEPSEQNEVTVDGIILKEIEGGYEVKGVEILSGEAIIPSEYNGKPVIRIGESAFEGRNDLTKVIIPAGVKEIGRYAFGQCGSLKEVVLSEGLESIGEHAFFGCYAIKRLEIPVSVTSVGEGAFEYWRQDQTIVVCGDFGRPPLGWSPNWLGKQGDPVLDWYYA